jgi:hypothetical protein
MALLYGRAGCLTALFGGSWPGQEGSGAAPCASAASAPASFVTALTGAWAPTVKWLQTANKSATFGYFRKEFTVPAGVESAQVMSPT